MMKDETFVEPRVSNVYLTEKQNMALTASSTVSLGHMDSLFFGPG